MRWIMLRNLMLGLVLLAGCQITLAQTSTVSSTVYRDQVRFELREPIKEFRVEVFNDAREKLFDSGFVTGGTLDWNMLDQQGAPVADGVYEYLVTTTKRGGKTSVIQSARLSILREGRELENAPALMQPAAPGSGGPGNVTGSGTAGQITKWTGTLTLGDSILTEKDGKIGLGTTSPVSLLHILGSHPVTSTLTGTNATEGLRIIGGKGGDTSGSGQTAGNGANLVVQAGDGGDALTGTSGHGGYVTIQPGAAGIGSIAGGFGQVLLAPGGGNVGIGVTNAGSKLTVAGMIETTLGGLKFPDGTTQTTAATAGLTSIFHDATLTGNGTSGAPLGVADGGIGTVQLASGAVTAAKIALGQVVTSLNGLKDQVAIQSGSNITITPSGNTLTIAAPNALTTIAHDATLTGNGIPSSSLGVAVPLNLTGAVPTASMLNGVIKATNTAESGIGVTAVGGGSNSANTGGEGVFALGGNSNSSLGGTGVDARGGSSNTSGGVGVTGVGGEGTSQGGFGVIAEGGNSDGFGGPGVSANGGSHRNSDGNGGAGIEAQGGEGSGASHQSGDGIIARAGVGINGANNGLAGRFIGDVSVSGNLSKGGGSFKIDHPLDPENKYLYHSFVESPDMKNIYDGTVTTDLNGEASVSLPDWFEALNRDFRYQLTVIGTFAQAIVADEIKGNRFTIKTSAPNVKVSWQVTGIRQDAYANKHRIAVEEVKPERERGSYLHPDSFSQPEVRGVEWVRSPRLMQRLKQQQIEAERKRDQK